MSGRLDLMSERSTLRAAVRVGRTESWALLVVVIGVLQGVVHLVNYFAIGVGFLDVNLERRPFALVQGVLIALAAVGAFVATSRGLLPRAVGLPMGTVLAFFVVDEVGGIHERLGVEAGSLIGLSESWDSVIWPIIYMPLAAFLLMGLWRSARLAPPASARLLCIAMGLLVAAVTLEVASAPFSTAETAGGVVHMVEGVFEEGFELVAWGFVAIALLAWRPRPARLRVDVVDNEGG